MAKSTVVFDFDGVIHSYISGWKGVDVIPDPPVEGIKETIDELRKDYKVVIVSTRAEAIEGRLAIRDYLKKHSIEVDGIDCRKPPAIVYVDDRAICFNGKTEGLVNQIKSFTPWNKKENKIKTEAKTDNKKDEAVRPECVQWIDCQFETQARCPKCHEMVVDGYAKTDDKCPNCGVKLLWD